MIQNISIIGGDLRNAYLAKILSNENNNVFLYGFEKENNIIKNEKNIKCNSIEEAIEKSDIIISSIPFSKDNKKIYMTLSSKEIEIKNFFEKIRNKTLIAGSISDDIVKLAHTYNIQIVDLMKIEQLVIYNTIATTEGTIQIAMEETNRVIYKSDVLVLGFGRVGRIVAERFYGLKANVYCEARKEEDIAWINAYGYNSIRLDELNNIIEKFDIIINTIPQKIIKEEQLKLINKNCLIIDLASNPGGVDFEKAQEFGIKTIHALGLPGRIAPYTSAKFINEIIKKVI